MIFWLFLEKIDCFPLKYLLLRRLASLLPRLASIDLPPDFNFETFEAQIDLENFNPENDSDSDNNDNELEDEPVHDPNQNEIVTIDRAMTGLTDLRAYLQYRGDNSEALQTLIQVERGLIKDKIESKKTQPRITHFFQ